MATTSFTALRRFAGFALTSLLICLCLCMEAAGQSTSSLVTSSVVTGLTPPGTWDTIWDTAASSNGDFVAADFQAGGVTQFQSGNPNPIVLFAPGAWAGGGWANNGIAIDPWNNLWLDNNWNGGLLWIPYNAATRTWNVAAAQTVANSLPIGYIQTAAIAINSNGTVVFSTENGSPQPALFSFTTDANGDINNFQTVVTKLSGRARTLSIDNAGNIYVFEDGGSGILMVPAGATGLADDSNLKDVEPTTPSGGTTAPLLSNISGATVDSAGNLYVGDTKMGIIMVPNQGGTLNPAAWVMISPISVQAQMSFSPTGSTIFVPTSANWNGIKDAATVSIGHGDLGSVAVGAQSATPASIYYSFTNTVTPAKFVIQEDGVASPDFSVVTGGSCAAGTTYPIPASSSANEVTYCTLNVAMSPQHVGNISAQLLMLDGKGNVLASTTLHGVGLGAAIAAAPASESAIGTGLSMPTQVATDAMDNVYVADAGLKQVLMYPAGATSSTAGVSIGTGLTQPTGVAVDGNGDVFIADSGSGNVFEIPYGQNGLNAAGQITLASSLGTNLRLAADGSGHLYVADPDNKRVVELTNLGGGFNPAGQTEIFLTAGFNTPTDVAVDANNNLYVVDGSNLIEDSNGAQTTVLNTLSGATGVAIDPSGAVYVSSSGGTVRIPNESGTLNPSDQTAIAASVTNPTAVTIDNMGNVYLADGAALNVHFVSASGAVNFSPGGTATVPPAASLDATITNDGNAPLTVTGYTSSNAVDYSAMDVSCESANIAPGSSCQLQITLDPGPGEQGTLTGQIQVQSNAANAPIAVNATGIGVALANSTSSISVSPKSEVVNTQVTVTVAPASGSGTPTGDVTVSYNSWTVSSGAIVPTKVSQTTTLTNGTATLTLTAVLAGSNTFTVQYGGDRVYGRSSGTLTATIAKSAITGMGYPSNYTAPSFLPYVLESNGSTPYDGSTQYWEYNFPVAVNTAAGMPTGTVTFMDNSSTCPSGMTCWLTGYSGQACPQQSGAAVQPINSSGQATFSTSCLPMPQNVTYTPIISTHTITPVYSGDANFDGMTGQPTTFQVVRSPALMITPASPSLSVSSGSTASINLTLTSILGYGFGGKNQQLNDYNFPVSLSCDNLPPHTSCTFTYPNPDPNISTAVDIPCSGTTAAADACATGSVTLTLNTNVAVGTQTSQISPRAPITFAAMFGFGLIGLCFRRRLGEKGRMLLILCMVAIGGAFTVSLTACGTTNLSPSSVLTTPSGTYAVTVTAEQVGSQVITLPTGPITIYGSENQVSLPYTINVTVQ